MEVTDDVDEAGNAGTYPRGAPPLAREGDEAREGHVVVMWWRCGGDVVVMWWRCGGDVVVMWW